MAAWAKIIEALAEDVRTGLSTSGFDDPDVLWRAFGLDEGLEDFALVEKELFPASAVSGSLLHDLWTQAGTMRRPRVGLCAAVTLPEIDVWAAKRARIEYGLAS